MPSERTADIEAALLETVRPHLPDQAVRLIADRLPAAVPTWIRATFSSTELPALTDAESQPICTLLVTPWVKAERLDAVIARARDSLTMDLYVLHPGDTLEQAERMGGLGLRCLKRLELNGQSWGLNHFSLKTYKKTPDWLSSRNWANPGLWDRFRW